MDVNLTFVVFWVIAFIATPVLVVAVGVLIWAAIAEHRIPGMTNPSEKE